MPGSLLVGRLMVPSVAEATVISLVHMSFTTTRVVPDTKLVPVMVAVLSASSSLGMTRGSIALIVGMSWRVSERVFEKVVKPSVLFSSSFKSSEVMPSVSMFGSRQVKSEA